MNPQRQRRLWLILAIVVAATAAATLIGWAIQRNITYLYTPSQVRQGEVPADARFRLGGVVCEGSVRRDAGSLEVEFAVTDRERQVRVTHDGILPDMFKEGTSVVATGRLHNGEFIAEEVLAKHDETYMPREVAAAMEKARKAPTHDCGRL